MERKILKIGMLGCGWMGRAHTNGYVTSRSMNWYNCNFAPELTVIGAENEIMAYEAAQRFGYKRCAGGWEEIVVDNEVDIIDNVTPDKLHVVPSLEAIKNRKHIICEKPLAVRADDARLMMESAEAAGVKHMCCFSYRFFPAVRLAYELVQSGALGKLYHFTGKYYQDQGSIEETKAEDIWYINWSGIGQGIASHLIDM
ncbi:MAG: Gfo/Idh/MocA family oxidoreductase, partial [Clostridia bacterium]|nr:Gfo/Idh/MocA family oxidoreductase [Clostridia bacterium]